MKQGIIAQWNAEEECLFWQMEEDYELAWDVLDDAHWHVGTLEDQRAGRLTEEQYETEWAEFTHYTQEQMKNVCLALKEAATVFEKYDNVKLKEFCRELIIRTIRLYPRHARALGWLRKRRKQ